MKDNKLKPCPFCGIAPDGIVFATHKNGKPAGYVLKITHNDQCFIEHLAYAYYGTALFCEKDWNRRAA